MKKLIALLLLLPIFAAGDPGPGTKYLINEPASLLDIGILRLQIHLDVASDLLRVTLDSDAMTAYWKAYYDFQNDEIVAQLILRYYDEYEEDTVLSPERFCRIQILTHRRELSWIVGEIFSHEGYKTTDQSDKFESQISDRFKILCSVTQRGKPLLEVFGMLNAEKIFVSRDSGK